MLKIWLYLTYYLISKWQKINEKSRKTGFHIFLIDGIIKRAPFNSNLTAISYFSNTLSRVVCIKMVSLPVFQ